MFGEYYHCTGTEILGINIKRVAEPVLGFLIESSHTSYLLVYPILPRSNSSSNVQQFV